MIFSGIGNAFNTEMGNTSAYIRVGNDLLMIDCGSAVFKLMNESNVLKNIENIHVIITHTHPDHAGSLGDLVFYAYYVLGIITDVYFADEMWMHTYLKAIGAVSDNYRLHAKQHCVIKGTAFDGMSIDFWPTQHVDVMPSFGSLIQYNEHAIYFSGDSVTLDKRLVTMLAKGELDRIYQDVCDETDKAKIHMRIEHLNELVPLALRSKVYIVHLESEDILNTAKSLGYGIVERFVAEDVFGFEKTDFS